MRHFLPRKDHGKSWKGLILLMEHILHFDIFCYVFKNLSKMWSKFVSGNGFLYVHSGVSEEKLETMFPTAAATSKLLKSGMSLTQIYNEYVIATDSLQLEKEENKRLNTYLDQILQVNMATWLIRYFDKCF